MVTVSARRSSVCGVCVRVVWCVCVVCVCGVRVFVCVFEHVSFSDFVVKDSLQDCGNTGHKKRDKKTMKHTIKS